MENSTQPEIIRAKLVVKSKTYLTPHYIRIILTGEEIGLFAPVTVGANNKIMVPENGQMVRRTYTLRQLDLEKEEMTIDFVAHGEDGPASSWAIRAQPSTTLEVMMKNRSKALFKPAQWYLLAGDHTALPVIGVLLERLPAHATGDVYLEVYHQDDILDLVKPANVQIHWFINPTPGQSSLIAEKVKTSVFPENKSQFVFAAAESATIKEIQHFLKEEKALNRDDWQAFAYWKLGLSEGA